jgi:hypothetical protein
METDIPTVYCISSEHTGLVQCSNDLNYSNCKLYRLHTVVYIIFNIFIL